ncbi:MAG: hypothetical protein KUG75_01190 [Pseudomonadales bacterium]|nr:hypothetical protein [Pseudomonadales bacterium]
MKVIYLGLVFVLAAFLTFQFSVRPEIAVAPLVKSVPGRLDEQVEVPNLSVDYNGERLNASVTRSLQRLDLSPRADARSLWAAGVSAEVVIIQRAFSISALRVYTDDVVLASLQPGDSFSMQIPQSARVLSATIMERQKNAYSTSLYATVDGSGGLLHAQVTFGEGVVFAEVETPEGVFLLEKQTVEGKPQALIYNQSEIDQHMDYTHSDAIPLEFRPEVVVDTP